MTRFISIHRWWLAFVAALLTPWIGPHSDRYTPVGWILTRAFAEAPEAGFWVIAGGFLVLGYLAWLMLLTGFTWLLRRKGKE